MDILPQLVANSVIAGGSYLLITTGFNLIYGTTKFINMAHGAVAAAGGYTVFLLTRSAGVSAVPAAVAGVLLAGCLGYLTDKIAFRPLRRRKASNLVLFVASLGIFTALQALIAMLFSSQFQTLVKGAGARVYEIGGAAITGVQMLILALGIASFLAISWVGRYTRFGGAVKAMSDDEEVAKIVGIDTDRAIGKVFFIGSCLAGLAGILIGFDTGLTPTMGFLVILEGATASIIGGIGNLLGGLIGSFLLAFAENFGIWKIASEWKPAIAFGLLVIFLIVRPQGILGRK